MTERFYLRYDKFITETEVEFQKEQFRRQLKYRQNAKETANACQTQVAFFNKICWTSP